MAKNSMRLLVFLALLGQAATSLGAEAAKIKIGLVLDKGGRDDKSFNAAAYLGATEAAKRLPIALKTVEASDDTAIDPSLRTFAQHDYPLVIGIGFVQSAAVRTVAADFPKTHFLIVDSEVSLPNVRSVEFKENEGSFLVGVIAALTSKTGAVGFIGGMDIPLIRRFELGYRSGAQAARKGIKVITNYVGSTSDAWKNPTKAKELALAQYQNNADVIFHAAGASGMGLFDAAEELRKFAIGCDSNQNWVKPGRILTSMVKRVDLAVSQAIESEVKGQFKPGVYHMGLKEGGVDYALDQYNRPVLSPEVEKKANELKEKIIKGQLKVPDYYELQKKPS